jgi:CopG family nickel-responsive transcriptional regulator
MAIVSISAPDDLVDEMDRWIKETGYAGRSEFIRAALRDFLAAQSSEAKAAGRVSATITLVYREGSERRVAEIKHEFTDIVTSMLHSHGPPSLCLEVLVVSGEAAKVRELANGLRSLREVVAVKVAIVGGS